MPLHALSRSIGVDLDLFGAHFVKMPALQPEQA